MGWLALADKPSMVTTDFPETEETGVTHERTACPLMWTVQAPHSDMPQPNFVPVSPSVSRRTHSSGIAGGASTVWVLPLRLNLTTAISAPPLAASSESIQRSAGRLRPDNFRYTEVALVRYELEPTTAPALEPANSPVDPGFPAKNAAALVGRAGKYTAALQSGIRSGLLPLPREHPGGWRSQPAVSFDLRFR